MSKYDYPGHSEIICRNALERGPLQRTGRQGGHWKFGRRIFSNNTVMKLIATGDAVRDGDVVHGTSNNGEQAE